MSDAFERAIERQRQAADPTRSVFVTANAGSGKTKVLIDRIVRLLMAGGAPSSFLCITFTKAAAAEMQRRLFERLGAWCVMDNDKLRAALAELGESAVDDRRVAYARSLFARALETPGGLRIQTIHAFCERLLARFPIEAGILPGFEIADDATARALTDAAWAQALEGGGEGLDHALDTLTQRFDAISLDGFLQSLVQERASFADFLVVSGGLSPALDHIRRRHRVTRNREAIEAEALALARWSDLREAAHILCAGGSEDSKAGDRVRAALAAGSVEAYMAAFVKEDGKAHGKAPTKSIRNEHPFVDRLFNEEQARLALLHAELCALERAEETSAALVAAEALIRTYAAAKSRCGVLDFDDLIERALRLLRSADAAPWVLFKLDGAVDHILVDEGQDTSPAQWSLLEPLQAEFFAGAGARTAVRTVFAVGDHKQSIYGFQGADPDYFLQEAQRLSKRAAAPGANFDGPSLLMSFRSTPEVLKAVDTTFAGLPLGRAEPSASDVVRHDAQREREQGCVEWWPLAPRPVVEPATPWHAPQDVDLESSAPAKLARELALQTRRWIAEGEGVWDKGQLRPMRAGDVLVLVRSRGPLYRQVLRAFKRAGLPIAGADRMVLGEDIAVMDVLAAARVALDPTDDLSLAVLLKSPFVGLSDDDLDLFPLAHGRGRQERLIERLRRAPARYASACAFVEAVIENAHASPFAFVSRLLETLDGQGVSGWERIQARLGADARDPLEELLSRALVADRAAAASLQHFVHAVEMDKTEIKRELENTTDAVRIMTVHGAKGLEAPVVFLPDTTAGCANDASRGEMLWLDGAPILCASAQKDDEAASLARAAADEAAFREHLRLLYVAMTRARDRLIVAGAFRGQANSRGHDERSWWRLVRDGLERAGAATFDTPFGEGLSLGRRLAAPKSANERNDPGRVEPPGWARTAAPTPPPRKEPGAGLVFSPRQSGRERFRRGLMIHGLLQRLPDIDPSGRRDAGSRWLAKQGVATEQAAVFLDEALAVLAHPDFGSVFGPHSRAEVPLVAQLGDGTFFHGVVDRLVVDAESVLVLDYKTDRPPPAAIEDAPERILRQMAAYRAAMGQIFPKRSVRAAVLWTEAPRLMEVPPALLDKQALT